MAKHTLKVFLKYVWPFYNIMHERVKQIKYKSYSPWNQQNTVGFVMISGVIEVT